MVSSFWKLHSSSASQNRISSASQRPGRRIKKSADLNKEIVQNLYHSAFLCSSVSWILSKLPVPSGHGRWRGLPLHSAPAVTAHVSAGAWEVLLIPRQRPATSLRAARVSGSISWCSAMPVAPSNCGQILPDEHWTRSKPELPRLCSCCFPKIKPQFYLQKEKEILYVQLPEIRSWLVVSIFANGLPGKMGDWN